MTFHALFASQGDNDDFSPTFAQTGRKILFRQARNLPRVITRGYVRVTAVGHFIQSISMEKICRR